MGDPSLPPAELDVMNCLWQGASTAAQIRETLSKDRPMAHASVCTLLKRLEAKGLVKREKGPVGKAFVYSANIKAATTRRSMLTELLERLFGGSRVTLVASLLETRPPNDRELEELESLLKSLRGKRARRPASSKSNSTRTKRS
jgi:BlaI family transcriptional regulator, penicillinase repressor